MRVRTPAATESPAVIAQLRRRRVFARRPGNEEPTHHRARAPVAAAPPAPKRLIVGAHSTSAAARHTRNAQERGKVSRAIRWVAGVFRARDSGYRNAGQYLDRYLVRYRGG